MVDMSAIAGAISSLNAAANITKAMKDLRDWSIMQSKVIELQSTILEAQGSLFTANEERAALIERVRQSERKIADLEAWDAERQRYQLTDIGDGNFAYALKESMSNGEPPHYLCTACYQNAKKAILHHLATGSGMHVLTCPGCAAKMAIQHAYCPPSHLQSEEGRARARLEKCPVCDKGRLKVTKVSAHPVMGDLGLQEKTLRCDNPACGHTEARMHDPTGLAKQ